MVAARTLSELSDHQWEEQLLEWFAGLGHPIEARVFQIGKLKHHLFGTSFASGPDRISTSHGRSTSRRMAAVKCAAECIERLVMLKHLAPETREFGDIPPSIRTSNGWAVHRTEEKARQASLKEAMERHLLMRSFLKNGWEGFRHVHQIGIDGLILDFIASGFRTEDYQAGIVIAKSDKYPGASMGYTVGDPRAISSMEFWEQGLHEAIDKILILNGREPSHDTRIRKEIHHYLMNPFSVNLEEVCQAQDQLVEMPLYNQKSIDLTDEMAIPFEFWASFTWGKTLIPLFQPSWLDEGSKGYITQALNMNGIDTPLPDRVPVL